MRHRWEAKAGLDGVLSACSPCQTVPQHAGGVGCHAMLCVRLLQGRRAGTSLTSSLGSTSRCSDNACTPLSSICSAVSTRSALPRATRTSPSLYCRARRGEAGQAIRWEAAGQGTMTCNADEAAVACCVPLASHTPTCRRMKPMKSASLAAKDASTRGVSSTGSRARPNSGGSTGGAAAGEAAAAQFGRRLRRLAVCSVVTQCCSGSCCRFTAATVPVNS